MHYISLVGGGRSSSHILEKLGVDENIVSEYLWRGILLGFWIVLVFLLVFFILFWIFLCPVFEFQHLLRWYVADKEVFKILYYIIHTSLKREVEEEIL
jgi:hypothetical protein